MRKTSARCSGPITPCCPTISTCRSAITAAPRRCAFRANRSSARPARPGPPTPIYPPFGPSKRLDFELELGVWIGQGNPLGQPIAIENAAQHIGGFCLLNDWSARDVQAWDTSRSARSWPRTSSPPSRHGSSRPRLWRPSAAPRPRVRKAIHTPCPICGTTPTGPPAGWRSISKSRSRRRKCARPALLRRFSPGARPATCTGPRRKS